MRKIALVYGVLSGLIVIASMILGIVLAGGEADYAALQVVGYLIMLIALSLIYFGIRKYRDTELNGQITFGKAALLGVAIATVAGIMYVAAWEVYLAQTDYAFMDDYAAGVIEAKKEQGIVGEELAKEIEKMEGMKTQYKNIWYRLPITFSEIFPVGLLIALISAALLRRKESPEQ